jgi:hypothetical protein
MNQTSKKDDKQWFDKPSKCIPVLFDHTTQVETKFPLFFNDPVHLPNMVFYNYHLVKVKMCIEQHTSLGNRLYKQALKKHRTHAKKNKIKRIKKPVIISTDVSDIYKLQKYSDALEWMGEIDIYSKRMKTTQNYSYYPIISGCMVGACSTMKGVFPDTKVNTSDPLYYKSIRKSIK